MKEGGRATRLKDTELEQILGQEGQDWLRLEEQNQPPTTHWGRWRRDIRFRAFWVPEPPRPSYASKNLNLGLGLGVLTINGQNRQILSRDPQKEHYLATAQFHRNEFERNALACRALAKALRDPHWQRNPEVRADFELLGIDIQDSQFEPFVLPNGQPHEKHALAKLYQRLGEVYEAKAHLWDRVWEKAQAYWQIHAENRWFFAPKSAYPVACDGRGDRLLDVKGRPILLCEEPKHRIVRNVSWLTQDLRAFFSRGLGQGTPHIQNVKHLLRPIGTKLGWQWPGNGGNRGNNPPGFLQWSLRPLFSGGYWIVSTGADLGASLVATALHDCQMVWENCKRLTGCEDLGKVITNPSARLVTLTFWTLYDFLESRSGCYRRLEKGGLDFRTCKDLRKLEYWQAVNDVRSQTPYLTAQMRALEAAITQSYSEAGSVFPYNNHVLDWLPKKSQSQTGRDTYQRMCRSQNQSVRQQDRI